MSDTPDYHPIVCSLHDRLEAACLRRQPVSLTWRDPDGHEHTATVTPRDVRTHAGAEYLVVDHDGEPLKIRLDQLLQFGDLPLPSADAGE